jgi:hypothetical protein
VPVMSLRGRSGRRGHPRGFSYRVCVLCSARVVYASRLVVDCTHLEHDAKAGAVLCNRCVARLRCELLANPLPVLTVEQRRREEKPRVRTKPCRSCCGDGCRRCDGRGRVAA